MEVKGYNGELSNGNLRQQPPRGMVSVDDLVHCNFDFQIRTEIKQTFKKERNKHSNILDKPIYLQKHGEHNVFFL